MPQEGRCDLSTVDCLIAAVCIEHEAHSARHHSDFTLLAKYAGLNVAKIDA